ncbi:hypothetical protein [Prescottella subtropica]|uniref:hypothetical protein n=1 Tax=Prescottella subtropica TaxID=2545757 RepID=UPI0010F867CD|nr:hypothetical protein [Prescottella subtropica]
MSGERQSMRDQVREYAKLAMTMSTVVAAGGTGVHMLLSPIGDADGGDRLAAAMTGVAGAGAMVAAVAGVVWVCAGIGRPGRGGVFHGSTRLPRIQDRMQVAQAAQSMTDNELDDAISALTATTARFRASDQTQAADRAAGDLAVCFSVREQRRQMQGPATH